MKKLLLTSAIVAVAGAAAAEITWSGDATFGYRTHDGDGIENFDGANGLFLEAGIDATGTAELDNGITATISYGFDLDYTVERENDVTGYFVGDDLVAVTAPTYGNDVVALDNFPTITIESSVATMTLGDVDHAAHELFKTAGADAVIELDADDDLMYAADYAAIADLAGDLLDRDFTEQDAEMVGRTDLTISTFNVGMSYVVADGYQELVDLTTGMGYWTRWEDVALPMNSYTVGANGSLAGFEMSLGFEYNDWTEESRYGVSTGYSWNGITGRIMYMASSWEVNEYSIDTQEIGIDANYEMSNGIKLGAGLSSHSGTYEGPGIQVTDQPDTMSYYVSAGFEALGADIEAKYEGTSTDMDEWASFYTDVAGTDIDEDQYVTSGFSIDASYEIEGTGVTVLAGYDSLETIVLSDSDNAGDYGAYYVGTTYDLGGGANVFATYSNGDEIGAAEYEPGARFGVSLSF